jgi:protein subunit release factor A
MLASGEIEIRAWKRQRGGQQAGLDSSIIAIHKPTGCAFLSSSERSQFKNKENALAQLEILVGLSCSSYADGFRAGRS